MMIRTIVILVLALNFQITLAVETGPVILGFGPHAEVKQTHSLKAEQKFKVVFDVADKGEPDKVNRKFESLARFINMQVAAGVKKENIQLALVVHGKAGKDLLADDFYQKEYATNNPNVALLQQLLVNNTRVILCGQSAAYYQIKNEQLIQGAEMALSAMTAHALLQQEGYTLNPF